MNIVRKEQPVPKLNCWEHKKCDRQLGGKKAQDLCACPASVFSSIHDGHHNNGDRLGRRCWRIPATLCDNEIQGTFKDKIEKCRKCSFYLLVKEEEGDDFIE